MTKENLNKQRILKLIALFGTIALIVLWIFQTQSGALKTGTRPQFPAGLVSIDGKPLTLNGEKNAPVVVNFFATWCTPCLVETPHFVKLSKKFQDKLIFWGLAVDSPLPHMRAFQAKFKISYPIAVAPFQMVADWKAEQLPMTYIINQSGEIVWSHRGYTSENELESAILAATGKGG